MQLAPFDCHPRIDDLALSDIPTGNINEYPDWPDIIEACAGLSLDEEFSVYELAEGWRDYPAGTLAVSARDRTYLQPVPRHGTVIRFPAEKIKYTASGVRCTQCPLAAGRTMVCDGVGPYGAKVMIIAEAPGEKEDKSGIPFVGTSGDFLKAKLAEVGFTPDDYFVTNLVRCRP